MQFPEDVDYLAFDRWEESLYRQALSWVNEDRGVIFISEEERFSEDPRVKIFHLESPLQWEGILKKIAWRAVLHKLVCFGEPVFCQQLESDHLAAGLILSEAADWGLTAMKNGRANRSFYRRGLDLQGAFAKIPALIVGAGPSLEKQKPLIREFAEKGLIFAGGTALSVLDVEPHFGGAIDADAPDRPHPFAHIPFCYQTRTNRPFTGEKLLFPDSSFAPLNWIYGEEPFDGGWTVGNFLTAAALHFGCDPIFLIGMDFCYAGDRKYAEIETPLPEGLIRVGDVWTQKDWQMAAQWTAAKQGPLFNLTEGGLLTIARRDFKTVLAELPILGDLRKKVALAIQNLPLHPPPKRWEEWGASKEVVIETLLNPLWQIWKPIFEREIERDPTQDLEIHRILFFQQVLEEHGKMALSER